MLPFIFGIFLAYFFDPVANWLCHHKFSRTISAALVVLVCTIILILVFLLLVPVVVHQAQNFLELIPEVISALRSEAIPYIKDSFPTLFSEIAEHATEQVQNKTSSLDLEQLITVAGKNFVDSSTVLFNALSLIFITPIVSFYILRDWVNFKTQFFKILPRQHADDVKKVLTKIDTKISAFIRGQLNVCLLIGTFYGLSLSIIGLHLGLLIGYLAGFLCFIPYLGSVAGIIMGIMFGYFQYGMNPSILGIIFLVFLSGQVIEGNFLTPKIVGDRLGIHPAILIFGMLSGGALLGLTGVILSVPITAILSVLVEYMFSKYYASELYK